MILRSGRARVRTVSTNRFIVTTRGSGDPTKLKVAHRTDDGRRVFAILRKLLRDGVPAETIHVFDGGVGDELLVWYRFGAPHSLLRDGRAVATARDGALA